MRSSGHYRHFREGFWKNLPFHSYVIFLLGVFFTFSSIGFVVDLMNKAGHSNWSLAVAVVYSGLIGAGYGYAATRNLKFIPAVLAAQVVLGYFLPNDMTSNLSDQMLSLRLLRDGFGILTVVILGYVFFIIFISRQGIRQFRLNTEIELARDIHRALVPPLSLRTGRFEIYGKSLPASEVGGDLLDCFSHQGELTCYVADVTGHGVSAGVLMGMFKSAARTNLLAGFTLQNFFENINEALFPLKTRKMFVTCAGLRFTEGDSVEFSVAGHLPILHFRKKEGVVDELLLKQIPVGIEEKYRFSTATVSWSENDLFAIVTDGLTEVADKRKSEFGLEGIKTILKETADQPLFSIFETVISAVRKHGKQRDDQTLLLVRCR
jgi:cytochrome c oxidase subunit IV